MPVNGYNPTIVQQIDSSFKVYKIDSITNFYLVYVTRATKRFKIISKKNPQDCDAIDIGKYYYFDMIYMFGQIAGGVFKPTCVGVDNKTNICLEDSITDLCFARNLKGLCIEGKK